MAGTRLQAIADGAVPLIGSEAMSAVEPSSGRAESALTGLLITSLRALSQRALIALSSIVDMALMASVFAVWLLIMGSPTVFQLVGAGMYAVFALIALLLRRRA